MNDQETRIPLKSPVLEASLLDSMGIENPDEWAKFSEEGFTQSEKLKEEFTALCISFKDRRNDFIRSWANPESGEMSRSDFDKADGAFLESLFEADEDDEAANFYKSLALHDQVDSAETREMLESYLFWAEMNDTYQYWAEFLGIYSRHLTLFWKDILVSLDEKRPEETSHKDNIEHLANHSPSLIISIFSGAKEAFQEFSPEERKWVYDLFLKKIESGEFTLMQNASWLFFLQSAIFDEKFKYAPIRDLYRSGGLNDFISQGMNVFLLSGSASLHFFGEGQFSRFVKIWFDQNKSQPGLNDPKSEVFNRLKKVYGAFFKMPALLKARHNFLTPAKKGGGKKASRKAARTRANVGEVIAVPAPMDIASKVVEVEAAIFRAPENPKFIISEDLATLSFTCNEPEDGLSVRFYVAETSRSGGRSNAVEIDFPENGLDLNSLRSERGDRLEVIVLISNQSGLRSREVLSLGQDNKAVFGIDFGSLEMKRKQENEAALAEAEDLERKKWELIEIGFVSFPGETNLDYIGKSGLMRQELSAEFREEVGLDSSNSSYVDFSRDSKGAIKIESFFGKNDYQPQEGDVIRSFLCEKAESLEALASLGMLGDLHGEFREMGTSLDMFLSSPELRRVMISYWQKTLRENGDDILGRLETHLAPTYEFEFTQKDETFETIKVTHESGQFIEVYCGFDFDKFFGIESQNIEDHRMRVILAELAKMVLASLAHQSLPEDDKEKAEEAEKQLRTRKEDAIKALNRRSGRGFRGIFDKPIEGLSWTRAIKDKETITLLRSRLNISRKVDARSIGFSKLQYDRLDEALLVPDFRKYLWRRILDTYAEVVTDRPVNYKSGGSTLIERPELKSGIKTGARRIFTQEELGRILSGDIRTGDLLKKTIKIDEQDFNVLDLFVNFMKQREVGVAVLEDLTFDAQDLFTFAKREQIEVVL